MNLEESHPIIPRIESEKIPLTNQIIPLVYRKKEKSSFSKTVIIITSISYIGYFLFRFKKKKAN